VPLELQIAKQLPDFTLDVALRAEDDAPLGILGPSGAGKSMLLRCIAGLETPDRGRIVLGDRVFFDSERRIRVPARARRVGFLFQHFALFPHRTVAENLEFGIRHLPVAERQRKVAALLRRTHIAGLEHRYPGELSGGEQQRVALARALAIEPEALMLDEPLSSLDTYLRGQIESQIQETFQEYRRPSLVVTHSMEEAYRLCRRLLVLSRGRVAAFGTTEEIFHRPPTAEVARLTGCKNISRARVVPDGLVEAADWNCRVRVADAIAGAPAYVAIRAHHIDFVESSMPGASTENVFPCWLVRSSETPFRITLFLCLRPPQPPASAVVVDSAEPEESPEDAVPDSGSGDARLPAGRSRRRFPGLAAQELDNPTAEFDLQAEVFKEKWERFRDQPQPWHVRLSPTALFLTPG
jgi:molybdate transport system ATP-binding protein/molybdate transport system permease protein